MCSVYRCDRRRKERGISKVTYHKFPRDEITRNAWINACGKPNWQPKKGAKICSLHFEVDCLIEGAYRRYLKLDSIPTQEIYTPAPPSSVITRLADPSSRDVPEDPLAIPSSHYVFVNKLGQALPPPPPPPPPPPATIAEYEKPEDIAYAKAKKIAESYKLVHRCNVQKQKCRMYRKKIKCLQERLRRQNKKILNYKNIIMNLKQLVNAELVVVVEDKNNAS